MSQTVEETKAATGGMSPELRRQLERASAHHVAQHREKSLRDFAEFRKRKEAEPVKK